MYPQCSSTLIDSIAPNNIRPRRMQPDRARRFLIQALLATLFSFSGAAPVMASPLQLPAIVEPASQEHHVGKVIFVELVTPDLAAAKQFYARIVWLDISRYSGRQDRVRRGISRRSPGCRTDSRDVPAGEHRQPAWLSFIAVRDVDAAKTDCIATWREGAVRAA